MVKTIRWPLPVQKQLADIYKYILKSSYQNAEKVKREILLSTKKLIDSPEINPPDKYKKNNTGEFRAYELHHYRISYYVGEK
ncbi:MAG: type II toxin-antitoxin system RelE/ParE family toxin [Ferruginibacter sp.]